MKGLRLGFSARSAASLRPSGADPARQGPRPVPDTLRHSGQRIFRAAWYSVNLLLLAAVVAATWSAVWEYSTRRYLKGFSDAIIPFSSTSTEKVQAILDWMSHSPARNPATPDSLIDDRNPSDTLNYQSLLSVCGTATNAFINLADSGGLAARRLLLLDENRTTVHVVAEVLIDGRWAVVDPTFRAMLRGPDGSLLTREDLISPAVFRYATRSFQGYDPRYVYTRAVHVRLSRFGALGRRFRLFLDSSLGGWEDSALLSLIVERESLAWLLLSLAAILFLVLLRSFLRSYGERRLGLRTDRFRSRLLRLGHILLEPVD